MANTNLAELNALATKITGQTVAENSIVAALNKIASYYKGSSVAEISNAAALAEIEDNYSAGGGDVVVESNKTTSITANGTVEITPTSGSDAMAKVTATVNVPPPNYAPEWYVTTLSVPPNNYAFSIVNSYDYAEIYTATGDGTSSLSSIIIEATSKDILDFSSLQWLRSNLLQLRIVPDQEGEG